MLLVVVFDQYVTIIEPDGNEAEVARPNNTNETRLLVLSDSETQLFC